MTEEVLATSESEADIEQWLNEVTPDEVRVPICMNRGLLAEFDRLIGEYEVYHKPQPSGIDMLDEETKPDPELEKMQRRIVELKQAIEDDERAHTYVFRKCDYEVWRSILRNHPPTEEQQEQYRGMVDHDIDRAAPEMVAASCIKPQMTPEQAERLRGALPDNVWSRLYNAAYQVNRTGTELPKSVLRTVDQLAIALKSTSPASVASRSAGSTGASQKKGSRNGRRTT